jgi:hypothetical protein
MAQHGTGKDNMTHITTMHDGLTQHDRLADRKDEEGRIDWSVMSEVCPQSDKTSSEHT